MEQCSVVFSARNQIQHGCVKLALELFGLGKALHWCGWTIKDGEVQGVLLCAAEAQVSAHSVVSPSHAVLLHMLLAAPETVKI